MSEKYLDLWKMEYMRSARNSLYLIYFFVPSSPLFLSLVLPLSHSPSFKENQRKLPLLSTVRLSIRTN